MKLLEIDLYTNDPVGTRRFYTCRLHLPIESESATHLTLRAGWTLLTFHLVEGPVSPYHLAFNVPLGSLEHCQHLFYLDFIDTQSPGQTIAEFPHWSARACYFYDNNGNLLEFIGRAGAASCSAHADDLIQCVSEIGLVTQDVIYTGRALQEQYGVGQFRRSIPRPDFNALGDDNGLIILSGVGRRWLFTETEAYLQYCRIAFDAGRGRKELYSYEVNTIPLGYHRSAENGSTATLNG